MSDSAVASRSGTMASMRECRDCDGPTTPCPHCRRHHCDDVECRGMPIECAQAADLDERVSNE